MRIMTASEWKSFARQNTVGATTAILTILIAAAMVTFSENAWITNISFFALLILGVSAVVIRIAKARQRAKMSVNVEWVPGKINLR